MKAVSKVSRNPDARAAMTELVASCREELHGAGEVVAGFVFFGADYDHEALASTLGESLPKASIIGCSTDGEITDAGLSMDSVTLTLLASSKVHAKALAITQLSKSSVEAGARLAQSLREPNARALILLPDGLTGNGSAIIRGALEVMGPQFIIAGGTAGDRGRFKQTWQICNGHCYTDAAVGMMLYSDAPLELGYGVMSGWKPIGVAKSVTRAEGNVVYSIENETALQVYSTFLGDKASQLPAIGVEYPFGLIDDASSTDTRGIHQDEPYILLRAPMAVDRDSGAVTFAAEIPQNSKVKMTRAKSQDVIAGAREAAERSQRLLTGKPDAVLFFSCMARKVVLGRKTNQEIVAAQDVFGHDVPMTGFYTYGEIANCGEKYPVCRFHNETATFLAVREP